MATALRAQQVSTAQEPSDVVVIKFSWVKERLPGWENNPFGRPYETYDDMIARVRDERSLRQARNSGNKGEVARIERDAKMREEATKPRKVGQQTERPRDGYKYKLTVRNTGARTIKVIDWNYIFYDADTQKEISRRQLTSEERISPGKEKEMSVFILTPLSETISASALGKKGQAILTGQVLIVRIEYSDGSVWERPAN